MFYHAVEEEIKYKRPFIKFLCIKGIVSLLFFQEIIVAALFDLGVIKVAADKSELLQTGIDQCLTIIELGIIFSFAYITAYDPREYTIINYEVKNKQNESIRAIKKIRNQKDNKNENDIVMQKQTSKDSTQETNTKIKHNNKEVEYNIEDNNKMDEFD